MNEKSIPIIKTKITLHRKIITNTLKYCLVMTKYCLVMTKIHHMFIIFAGVGLKPGADPGFFLGGGALVSCSTSTPINHIVLFFFSEYQLY